MPDELIAPSALSGQRPLVIDLDGTLLRSDLLFETLFASFAAGWPSGLLSAASRGRAALKAFFASRSTLDYATLPYDEEVLAHARRAKAEGRPVYLATASNGAHAEAIAAHLGLFDGVFASDAEFNLKGAHKAARLVEAFGARGFDYIGDSGADLPVWAQAGRAYHVRAGASTRARLAGLAPEAEAIETPPVPLRKWLEAVRVHQYAKNLLLFVPMFTAHKFTLATFGPVLAGVIAFSLCASSVYLLNDLVDLQADRAHLTKRNRPLASGAIPIAAATVLAPVLLLAAGLVAAFVSPLFLACLAGYFAMTTAYTFSLKSKMIADVVTLALLYTVRVLAGGIAADVIVSQWLLAFSIFIFMSLALMKRYVELANIAERSLPDPRNRNYKVSDLPIIAALAAASGMNSVTIFALYISSSMAETAYSRPWALWLACPVLLYWLARALMMAHRRLMDDDPVVFALRDRVSRRAFVCIVALVLIAI